MKTEFVSRSAIMILAIAVPLFAREACGISWVEIASLPEPRWFLKAAAGDDGRVYAFGGWIDRKGKFTKTKGFGPDALLAYDPSTQEWVAGPPAPFFRFPRLSRRTIEIGDKKEYRWEPVDPGAFEPQLEGPIAAADRHRRIFWFSKAGPIFYDIARNAWDQPPGPVWKGSPEFRFVSGAVPHLEHINAATATGPDGKIYIVGGAGNALGEPDLEKQLVLLDSLEVYDPIANTYAMKAPMHRGRQIFAAEFGPDGKLYVFGGYGTVPSVRDRAGESPEERERRRNEMIRLGRRALDSVEAYDPATDTWTARRKLPRPVQSGEAARCPDGRIYLVGGEPALKDARAVDDVYIYDTSRDEWKRGPSLRTARHGHGLVCTADGKLYAIGGTNAYTVATFGSLLGGEGEDKGGPLASVEVLDTRLLTGTR
jgi:N-acetylneuraminic acid mutarotase